jgi:hypothetical protein
MQCMCMSMEITIQDNLGDWNPSPPAPGTSKILKNINHGTLGRTNAYIENVVQEDRAGDTMCMWDEGYRTRRVLQKEKDLSSYPWQVCRVGDQNCMIGANILLYFCFYTSIAMARGLTIRSACCSCCCSRCRCCCLTAFTCHVLVLVELPTKRVAKSALLSFLPPGLSW